MSLRRADVLLSRLRESVLSEAQENGARVSSGENACHISVSALADAVCEIAGPS